MDAAGAGNPRKPWIERLPGVRYTRLGLDLNASFGIDATGRRVIALSWDYDHDNFKWDVVMYGPFARAIFTF
ncbi:MAG TPA: hypothetical protein VHN11_05455 [Xanthobacteraceae bacterium]|nr:hypothetical protein [Xanthobacteraceae bacterium]